MAAVVKLTYVDRCTINPCSPDRLKLIAALQRLKKKYISSHECNTAVTQFSTFFRRDKKLSQFVVFCYTRFLIRRI